MGVLLVVLVPVGFAVWAGLYLVSSLVRQDAAVLVVGVILYLGYLVSEVTYDTPKISRIDMKGINPKVEDLITKTTSKGDRLYVILLRAFPEGTKLSQTDLFKRSEAMEVHLTQPQVREYIIALEEDGLISSPQTKYAKEYELTEWGRWCRHVINQLLPSRNFLFVLRNYLGYRSIPSEPSRPSSSKVQSV